MHASRTTQTHVPAPSGPAATAFPIAYRVFQRRDEPGLCCAVPRGLRLPPFVRPEAWRFGGTLDEDGRLPPGFHPVPAREASAAFGYYLFHEPCESLSPRRRLGADVDGVGCLEA